MSGFPSCFNGVCSTMYIKMVYETILETNVLEQAMIALQGMADNKVY